MCSHLNCSWNSTPGLENVHGKAPVWVITCVGCVSGVTIILNIPAIIAVASTKIKSSNFRNVHLLSLSVTDTLVAVSMIPILLTYIFPEEVMPYWLCGARFIFFGIGYFNSMAQVFAICVDRLSLLARPSWRFTVKYGRRMAGISLLTLTVISIIIVFPFIIFTKPQERITCELDHIFDDNIDDFCLYIGVVALLLQILIIGCCFLMLGILQTRRLNRRQYNVEYEMKKISTIQELPKHGIIYEKSMTLEMKGMITIAIIVALFTFCVTPFNLGFLLQGLRLLKHVDRTTRHIFMTAGCLNSAINPIIYSFRVPEMKIFFTRFRKKMASIHCALYRQKSYHDSS